MRYSPGIELLGELHDMQRLSRRYCMHCCGTNQLSSSHIFVSSRQEDILKYINANGPPFIVMQNSCAVIAAGLKETLALG